MCGIVGYIGRKNAVPFLINGLKALEYRGYDSAGIYIAGKGVLKRAGKVAVLASSLPDTFSGNAGIAHTRWATHGPRHNGTHIHIRMLHKPYGSFITASSRIIQSCAILSFAKELFFVPTLIPKCLLNLLVSITQTAVRLKVQSRKH